jgi:ribonuclease P protein component
MDPAVPGGLERLRSPRDVASVLRRGRRRARARCALHVLASSPEHPARLAVVASRRVGNAPARNRAKRLMREASRRIAWPSGHDLVLVARSGIRDADMWQVLDDVQQLAGELLGPPAPVAVGGRP